TRKILPRRPKGRDSPQEFAPPSAVGPPHKGEPPPPPRAFFWERGRPPGGGERRGPPGPGGAGGGVGGEGGRGAGRPARAPAFSAAATTGRAKYRNRFHISRSLTSPISLKGGASLMRR